MRYFGREAHVFDVFAEDLTNWRKGGGGDGRMGNGEWGMGNGKWGGGMGNWFSSVYYVVVVVREGGRGGRDEFGWFGWSG